MVDKSTDDVVTMRLPSLWCLTLVVRYYTPFRTGTGRRTTLTSRLDDPRETAFAFGKLHNLSDNYVNQIEQFIRAHIA